MTKSRIYYKSPLINKDELVKNILRALTKGNKTFTFIPAIFYTLISMPI